VKNLFELKNARHVVIERNVMERSWRQAQGGLRRALHCPQPGWRRARGARSRTSFRANLVRDVAAGS
jgi:hypothetical protein